MAGLPIIAMIVMLGVLVFVHECGHFFVGKWCGLAVESFSIGFGPQLAAFRYKGTIYRIGILPLGGYVKFVGLIPGEDPPADIPGIPYNKASKTKRVLAVAAGPVANLILAFFIYSFLAMAGMNYHKSVVGFVMPESPAQKAGLMVKDQITAIAGEDIQSWQELNKVVRRSVGVPLDFKVRRQTGVGETQELSLKVTPEAVEGLDLLGRKKTIGRIGIGSGIVPAIVTVTDPTSAAAKSGLVTGHKIHKVTYAGKVNPITDYEGFKQVYQAWLVAEAPTLELEVSMFVPGSKNSEGKETLQSLTLSEKIDFNLLGAQPSQTTVAEAKHNLTGLLKYGDVLLSLDGKQVATVFDIYDVLEDYNQPKIAVTMRRGQKVKNFELSLKEEYVQKPEGRVKIYTMPVAFLGSPVTPPMAMEVYSNVFSAAWFGVKRTLRDTGYITYTLFKLVTGDVPLKSLGGPILIAKVASDSAKLGWRAFIMAMALISINLAVINMFPIPALDGGQLVLIGFEALRGQPLSEPAMENFQKIGFVMIMALVVLAFSNDLSRFWADILSGMTGFFE